MNPDQTLRPLRILVADDDGVTRRIVSSILEREGYDVVTAVDGWDALRAVQERHPHLVLLDVTMPGPEGYEVCRQIQARGPEAPPVVFLTMRGDTRERVTGLEAGAVDYVVKPFEPEELLARVRAALRTKAVVDRLAAEATSDPLTGLVNRKVVRMRVERAIALAERQARPLALLMLDVDRFKQINDSHGHAAGDAVLVAVARRIQAVARETDTVARYGGDEFLVLLEETEPDRALEIGGRIRASVSAEPIALRPASSSVGSEGPRIHVSASVGVASWDPSLVDADALFAAVDEALYRAKARGRGRVVARSGAGRADR